MELTNEQIERQDFVDNAIFAMLNELNPSTSILHWDIELIGSIRDSIQEEFVKRKVCSAQRFYPELND